MKYSYFWALPVAALLSLAGCSNDDTLQADNGKQQNTVPAGMTEFADGVLTRTAGTYDGSAIKDQQRRHFNNKHKRQYHG